MPVTELTIDRTKWGQGSLLRGDGRMCCLGHLSVACGVPIDNLVLYPFPLRSWTEVNDAFRYGRFFGNDPASGASAINDSSKPSAQKEQEIIALFAENGVAVTFVGEGECVR